MNDLNFKLETFEGPLDLLLRLIAKNQVDIYDIPISLIFDQYMEYLEKMRAMDMEIAGEFITMAAELMLIKSRMLLPSLVVEDEEDPRATLAAALLEYKKAKEAAQYLGEQYDYYSARFVKDSEEIEFEEQISDQSITLLEQAFLRMLNRHKLLEQSMTKEPEQALETIIRKRVTPIKEREVEIKKMLTTKKRVAFTEIMLSSNTRSDIIASFVALLEMLKSQQIVITTDSADDEIFFEINENQTSVEDKGGENEQLTE